MSTKDIILDHAHLVDVRIMRFEWLKVVEDTNQRWTGSGRGGVALCLFLWGAIVDVQYIDRRCFRWRRLLFVTFVWPVHDSLILLYRVFAVSDWCFERGLVHEHGKAILQEVSSCVEEILWDILVTELFPTGRSVKHQRDSLMCVSLSISRKTGTSSPWRGEEVSDQSAGGWFIC